MADIVFGEFSGLNDSLFGKSIAPIKRHAAKKAEAFEKKSVLKTLFSMDTSDNWAEKETEETGIESWDPMVENGEIPLGGMQEGYSRTFEHIEFSKGFAITRKMMDDIRLLKVRDVTTKLMTSYYRTRELFGHQLYIDAALGKLESNFKGEKVPIHCADGKPLFYAEHPSLVDKKLKQCNFCSDAFSKDALAAAESEMQNFKGYTDEEILTVVPDTIVIPNDYKTKMTVFEVIGSDKDPNSSNNGFNFLYGRWNVIVDPYLNKLIQPGTTVPWFLMSSEYNQEVGGARWYDRVKGEIDAERKTNRTRLLTGYARWGAGFKDWRFIYGGGMKNGKSLIG